MLIPQGDARVRAYCSVCQTIQYQNPINVVGTIAYWQDKVLLCRRNIEPRYGYWTLPAGFLELGETLMQGAARETQEEAGAQFNIGNLHSVLDVAAVGQVHFFYLAQLVSDQFAPGPESIEARLFSQAQIPWDQLAFPTNRKALELYFQDYGNQTVGQSVHTTHID